MATYASLGAIAFVFVVQMVLRTSDPMAEVLWFVIGTDWPVRPWTLVTSTLAHGNVQHLLFNGLFLFFFGPGVERLVGRKAFLALFFISGAVAGVAQVHLDAMLDGAGFALGASGALMALMGTLIVLTPKERILVWGIVPVPLWLAGIGYAALDVLGALDPYSSVGNFAHLSGMAIGLAYGAHVKAAWRRKGIRLVRG